MRVNQAGCDNFRAHCFEACRNLHLSGRSNLLNLSVSDQHDAVVNRLTGHRINRLALDGELLGGNRRSRNGQECENEKAECRRQKAVGRKQLAYLPAYRLLLTAYWFLLTACWSCCAHFSLSAL